MMVEIQDYLDYIRGMGIEAWIPGTQGYGPKMSVADQCRSKVLCLNYNGLEIYIRGRKNVDVIKCKVSSRFTDFHCQHPIKYNRAENDTANKMHSDTQNEAKIVKLKKIERFTVPSTRSVGVQCTLADNTEKSFQNKETVVKLKKIEKCTMPSTRSVGIQCTFVDNTENLFLNKDSLGKNFKHHEPTKATDEKVENERYDSASGVQFRRTITQKLTREVRVAKSFVSSWPEVSAGNPAVGKGPVAVEKFGLSPGFVRKMAKRFVIRNNGIEFN